MKFGPVPLAEADGAVLAHSVGLGTARLRKGMVLGAADLNLLAACGLRHVTVARLDAGDVAEDAAAAALARALVPDPVAQGLVLTEAATGRVNLKAVGPGIVQVDAAAVQALNLVDPSITLATLPAWQRVTAGMLVGTVKIISYAVDGVALSQACQVARGAVRVLPVVRKTAGLVLTEVAGQDAKLTAKGRRAMEGRLRALGMRLGGVEVVTHDPAAIGAALAGLEGDLLLILTGSATSDMHDTAPEAVRRAGGTVARFGMPVDPGNLLFLGDLAGRPVIGLPGCARSPALNGADWVLERLACGLTVTDADIAGMGVGGLLKEIKARSHLREAE